jgi:proline iminopeptidase
LVYAVIGMGQQVDTKRGETISYRFVLERAHADRNRKAIRALEELGSSDTFWKGGKFVERMWLLRLGGVMHSVDLPTMVKILLEAPEYSIADCIRYARNSAARFSIPLMADGLLSVNLVQEIKRLSVPIVLFEGRHDHTCPPEIAEEFYNSLQAPYKQWVWFENSGHTPDLEEPEKFEREVLAVGQRFCAATPTAAA